MLQLYLPIEEGGRGLLGLVQVWEREVTAVAEYLLGNDDEQVRGAMKLQAELARNAKPCTLTQAEEILSRHGMDPSALTTGGSGGGKATGTVAKRVKKAQTMETVSELKEMVKHGVFAKQIRMPGSCQMSG